MTNEEQVVVTQGNKEAASPADALDQTLDMYVDSVCMASSSLQKIGVAA